MPSLADQWRRTKVRLHQPGRGVTGYHSRKLCEELGRVLGNACAMELASCTICRDKSHAGLTCANLMRKLAFINLHKSTQTYASQENIYIKYAEHPYTGPGRGCVYVSTPCVINNLKCACSKTQCKTMLHRASQVDSNHGVYTGVLGWVHSA